MDLPDWVRSCHAQGVHDVRGEVLHACRLADDAIENLQQVARCMGDCPDPDVTALFTQAQTCASAGVAALLHLLRRLDGVAS